MVACAMHTGSLSQQHRPNVEYDGRWMCCERFRTAIELENTLSNKNFDNCFSLFTSSQ